MRHFRFTVLAVLILLLFVTGCDRGDRLEFLRPNDVLLAFGDSLTKGTGADEKKSYPAQLEKMLSRTVINAGIPGEITAEGLRRLPELLDEHEPDMIILCHGGNDILRRLDRAKTIANLKAMITEAQSRNIPIILVSVPQFGLFIDSAPFYKEIATEFKIYCEDKIVSEILADKALKSDTIHPNAAGYTKMAEGIADLLKKHGAL